MTNFTDWWHHFHIEDWCSRLSYPPQCDQHRSLTDPGDNLKKPLDDRRPYMTTLSAHSCVYAHQANRQSPHCGSYAWRSIGWCSKFLRPPACRKPQLECRESIETKAPDSQQFHFRFGRHLRMLQRRRSKHISEILSEKGGMNHESFTRKMLWKSSQSNNAIKEANKGMADTGSNTFRWP